MKNREHYKNQIESLQNLKKLKNYLNLHIT